MDENENKLGEELLSGFEDLKKAINDREDEVKRLGEVTAETKQLTDRINDRLDAAEVKLEQIALAPAASDTKEHKRELTNQLLRFAALPPEVQPLKYDGLSDEVKALVIRDESLGGILAPAEFVNEVIKGIVQYSPIRAIARTRQTSRLSIQFPKRTGVFAAVWTAEVTTRTETTGLTFGLEEIPTHEEYARVQLSNWDLEDPVVDLEAEVRMDMEEQFGVAEGTAFVSGDANGKPEGFLSNLDAIATPVLNGGASFTSPDGVIKLAFAPKEQYWANARFVLNRFSLRDVRLLKDTTNNYLWQPGVLGQSVALGIPATIFGYPYTIAKDMPNAASNALTVAFGDFGRAYLVVDHVGLNILRDPYTQASAGQVVLHARKRVGGQTVLPEAIAVLKMA